MTIQMVITYIRLHLRLRGCTWKILWTPYITANVRTALQATRVFLFFCVYGFQVLLVSMVPQSCYITLLVDTSTIETANYSGMQWHRSKYRLVIFMHV